MPLDFMATWVLSCRLESSGESVIVLFNASIASSNDSFSRLAANSLTYFSVAFLVGGVSRDYYGGSPPSPIFVPGSLRVCPLRMPLAPLSPCQHEVVGVKLPPIPAFCSTVVLESSHNNRKNAIIAVTKSA
jgi:hypothetical protein